MASKIRSAARSHMGQMSMRFLQALAWVRRRLKDGRMLSDQEWDALLRKGAVIENQYLRAGGLREAIPDAVLVLQVEGVGLEGRRVVPKVLTIEASVDTAQMRLLGVRVDGEPIMSNPEGSLFTDKGRGGALQIYQFDLAGRHPADQIIEVYLTSPVKQHFVLGLVADLIRGRSTRLEHEDTSTTPDLVEVRAALAAQYQELVATAKPLEEPLTATLEVEAGKSFLLVLPWGGNGVVYMEKLSLSCLGLGGQLHVEDISVAGLPLESFEGTAVQADEVEIPIDGVLCSAQTLGVGGRSDFNGKVTATAHCRVLNAYAAQVFWEHALLATATHIHRTPLQGLAAWAQAQSSAAGEAGLMPVAPGSGESS